MQTISDIIQQILPNGSNPLAGKISGKRPKWNQVPLWPPDLFAVVATIVERSGCYSDVRYSCKIGKQFVFGKEFESRITTAATYWRSSGTPPTRVNRLWSELLTEGPSLLSSQRVRWRDLAIELLVIADEASTGMGFYENEPNLQFARFAHKIHIASLKMGDERFLSSLCLAVPPDSACVQPKGVTSQVGCTLRSLSHHLALLPPVTQVRTRWNIFSPGSQLDVPLNVLLVPFPYRISNEAFVAGNKITDMGSQSSHFRMIQNWIPKDRMEICNFISDMIATATREVGQINGVVLPELALDRKTALILEKELQKISGLEFFVSGIFSPGKKGSQDRNLAFTSLFADKRARNWEQSKHHRWKLNESQIRRYRLEHRLDPKRMWWEEIDIGKREANFFVFRSGASMSVLVCEDLARIDPIQPILRSIGPNLVIALLQDGPQLISRWSDRYATVLSDDPGSAVLCLTSLGMVKRSMLPSDKEFREVIALWKDPKTGTKELSLKQGDQGVVLKLAFEGEAGWTLDGRTDGGQTKVPKLEGVYPISLTHPPVWAL